MAFNQREQAYLDLHNCIKLTDYMAQPVERQLFLTEFGAVTIACALQLTQIREIQAIKPSPKFSRLIPVSTALSSRNIRCIDKHGCSMLSGKY
jgi:hypothetical protein